MKKILFILLFLPLLIIGQDVDLTDGNRTFSTNIHVDEYITVSKAIHLFAYFGDSTITFTYAAQGTWYHVTNASDSLFRYTETDGFTVDADTIIPTNTADYDFTAKIGMDGGNGEAISYRFYNVTQATGIPTASVITFSGTGSYNTISVGAYGDVTAGDKIILQLKNGDVSPANSIIKNGSIKIYYVHD